MAVEYAVALLADIIKSKKIPGSGVAALRDRDMD